MVEVLLEVLLLGAEVGEQGIIARVIDHTVELITKIGDYADGLNRKIVNFPGALRAA
jgi:hypothetical protein